MHARWKSGIGVLNCSMSKLGYGGMRYSHFMPRSALLTTQYHQAQALCLGYGVLGSYAPLSKTWEIGYRGNGYATQPLMSDNHNYAVPMG